MDIQVSTVESRRAVIAAHGIKPGATVQYVSYGALRIGTVERIGDSGMIYLAGGKFLFPESLVRGESK